MKKKSRHIIAFLVSVILIASEVPVPALAAETMGSVETTEDIETVVSMETAEDIENVDSVEVAEEADNVESVEEPGSAESAEEFDLQAVHGYIPDPLDSCYESPYEENDGNELLGGFESQDEQDLPNDGFPAKYISDAVVGKPSRNQNPYGTCWAFATMSAVELSAKQKHVEMPGGGSANNSTDLSELHLAYFAGKNLTPYDPLHGLDGDRNGNPNGAYAEFLSGGSFIYGANLLASWIGAADESKYPYENNYNLRTYSTDQKNAMDDVIHLRNYYVANPRTDRRAVKELITEYGGVTAGYWDYDPSGDDPDLASRDMVHNQTNNCYYVSSDKSANHAVAIVGWDDDFSEDRFTIRPEGKGAWLIRNSWAAGNTVDKSGNLQGSNAAFNSYFWLSYYDCSLGDAVYAFEMDPVAKYDNNFQYDGCMNTGIIQWNKKYANIFTVPQDLGPQMLKAVYFASHSAQFDCRVDIYTGVSGSEDPDPTSGTLALSQWEHITYAGGHTIELDEPVSLDENDRFSVVITVPSDTAFDCEESVPARALAQTETNRSRVLDGDDWKGTAEMYGDSLGDLRIKAFTCDCGNTITLHAEGGYFDAIGNPETKIIKRANGDTYGSLDIPVKGGFNFDGWYTEDNKPVRSTDTVKGDIDLYANWLDAASSVFVYLWPEGGACDRQYVFAAMNGTYGLLPVPVREGFTFDGWYTSKTGGEQVTEGMPVISNSLHALYAHWRDSDYTLTLQANGGKFADEADTKTIPVRFGQAYGDLLTPELEGYDFAGWSTSKEGPANVTKDTVLTEPENRTVYALWKAKTCKVTFNGNGGKILAGDTLDITETYDSVYILPEADPERTGYEFAGWFTAPDGGTAVCADTVVKNGSDHEVYAHWNAGPAITVTFDANGGTFTTDGQEVTVVEVKETYDSKYTLPEKNPERTGYEFSGWSTALDGGMAVNADTVVKNASDHTLYARFTARNYTVTYDGNGGTPSDGSKTVTFGSPYGELADVLWEGHTFSGWATSPEGGILIGADTVVSEENIDVGSDEHVLYAQWNPRHKVTFDKNASDAVCDTESRYYEEGTACGDLPIPQRPGYTFTGWYDWVENGKEITSAYTVDSDLTVYAHWELKALTVSFYANQQFADTPPDIQVRLGEPYGELPVLTAYFNDRTFLGWGLSKDDDTLIGPDTIVTISTDHTLYGKWGPTPHQVTFDENGGSLDEAFRKKTVYFGKAYGTLPLPEREGFEFLGWYKKGEDVSEDTIVYTLPDEVLTAHWKKRICHLTIYANGGAWDDGSTEKNIDVEYGGSLSQVLSSGIGYPVWKGFRFVGWQQPTSYNGQEFTTYADRVTGDDVIYALFSNMDENNKDLDESGFVIKDIPEEGCIYTGDAIKPKIRVYDYSITPDRPLSENTDYTIKYKNNVNAYTLSETDPGFDPKKAPSITITGKGNYSNSLTVYFKINPRRIDIGNGKDFAEEFSVQIADKPYNSKKQISKPVIKYGKKQLRENKDFTVSFYENGLETEEPLSGDIKVVVTAVENGNYAGKAETSYYIYDKDTEKSVSNAVIKIKDQSFTGEEIDLSSFTDSDISVKDKNSGHDDLKLGTDYTLRYAPGSNKVNAGSATIEVVGINSWKGKKTASFKIIAMPVVANMITVSDATFTGKDLKPNVTVTNPVTGEPLEGTDYTVTYSNNTNAAPFDAGNKAPKVTVKGKGNYSQSASKTFTIAPAELSRDDLEIVIPDVQDKGKELNVSMIKPVVKYHNPVLNKTVTLKKGKDYSVDDTLTGVDRDKSKELKTVKFILCGNYINDPEKNEGNITEIFRYYTEKIPIYYITPRMRQTEFTYTGSKIIPEIIVTKDNLQQLVEGKDYRVTVSNNVNAYSLHIGENGYDRNKAPKITITGMGAYTGKADYPYWPNNTFVINKKELTPVEFELVVSDVKWTGKQLKPSVKVIEKATGKVLAASNYTVEYGDTTKITEFATITVTGKGEGNGSGNYCGKLTGTFRVYEKAIAEAVIEKIDPIPFNGSIVKPKITAYPNKDRTPGTELLEYDDYTLAYGLNNKNGTGTVIVTGKGRYGGTAKLTFKITAKKMQ